MAAKQNKCNMSENGGNILRQRHGANETTDRNCNNAASKSMYASQQPILNPFVHQIQMTIYDYIKIAVLTVIVLPFRVMGAAFFLVVAWILACVGLIGIPEQDLREKPLKGWRRDLRAFVCLVMRCLFMSGGFHWISYKGKQASAKEAPILALAPHSTFFDALPVILLGAPSIVAKAETEAVPFFGKLINFTQPVYVWRDDPNSRQNTIKEIVRRSTSDDDWQQILIFPEGTCTNRTAFITFKPGAFIPGVPVQPVCINYPNRLDTVSWTWEGPGALKLLWLTLTQFTTHCELEFLPVYHPSAEEKSDPKLYAMNVRRKMAEASGIPVTDYTYEDSRLMTEFKKLGFPPSLGLVCIDKLRVELNLEQKVVEKVLLHQYARIANPEHGEIVVEDLARYLHCRANHPVVRKLFDLFDNDNSGTINFGKYLIGVVKHVRPLINTENLRKIFDTWDIRKEGRIERSDLNINGIDAGHFFSELDVNSQGSASFGDFCDLLERKPEYAFVLPPHS